MKLTYQDCIKDVDIRCQHCKHMVLAWNSWHNNRGKPMPVKRCECRLSVYPLPDWSEIRGYCGSANPDKCNNGTKKYKC